jgi:hypothetical protein
MKLISTYYSDDQLRMAMVFKKETEYVVDCINNRNHQELKFTYDLLEEAEEFAEDWVLV